MRRTRARVARHRGAHLDRFACDCQTLRIERDRVQPRAFRIEQSSVTAVTRHRRALEDYATLTSRDDDGIDVAAVVAVGARLGADCEEYAFPPGNTSGHRCVRSPAASVVTGRTGPPVAGMLTSGAAASMVRNSVPSSDHAMPRTSRALAIVDASPSIAAFRMTPSAKNATHFPSGESTGPVPRSLPGTTRALGSGRRRT